MTPKSRLVSAFAGQPRRFCVCRVFGPPRSSGQVSNATHGVIAIRAPSGHLMGLRFGLTFMFPPAINFASHATVAENFATEHRQLGERQREPRKPKYRRAAPFFALDLTQDAS